MMGVHRYTPSKSDPTAGEAGGAAATGRRDRISRFVYEAPSIRRRRDVRAEFSGE